MKRLLLFLLVLIGFFSVFYFVIKGNDEIELIKGAKSGILMEEKTGKVLYEKNKNERLSPASMTKIMTLLLVFEALDNNTINKDDVLVADEYSCSMGGSQVYLEVGEEIKVSDAIKCVSIASANDCAVLLATAISGSEEMFVNNMNKRAKELGCENTNFSDCTGLSSQNHYSSAYDMAIMSQELINNHSEVLEYTSVKEDYIREDTDSPFWLVNTNKLLGRVEGLNGLKTGFTSFSGYCITLHMKQGNMGLISVVFGYDKSTTRNTESIELLRYGFSNYKLDCVLKKGTVLEEVDHILYKNKVEIVVSEDIYYLCRKTDSFNYEYDYSFDDSYNGNINVYYNNEIIASENITTKNEVVKKNLFEIMFSLMKETFI